MPSLKKQMLENLPANPFDYQRILLWAVYDAEKQQHNQTDVVNELVDGVKELRSEISNLGNTIAELMDAVKELRDAVKKG